MFERKKDSPVNDSQLSFNKNIRKTVFGVTIIGLLGYTTGALFPNLPSSPRINIALGAFAFLGILSMLGLILFLYTSSLLSRNPTTEGHTGSNNSDIRNYKKDASTPATSETSVQAPNESWASIEENILDNLEVLKKNEIAKFDFTPRESEVAFLLLSCDTYKNMAQQQYCSESNLKFHAGNIFQKAHVKNREAFKDLICQRLIKSIVKGIAGKIERQ